MVGTVLIVLDGWGSVDCVAADRKFIEMRRRALKRFLNLTVRHPILTSDEIVKYFLTFNGSVSVFKDGIIRQCRVPGFLYCHTLRA